jgi:hypothetical protein
MYMLARQLLQRIQSNQQSPAESATAAEAPSSSSSPPLSSPESFYPQLRDDQLFVVFVSNPQQQVLLWKQQVTHTCHPEENKVRGT